MQVVNQTDTTVSTGINSRVNFLKILENLPEVAGAEILQVLKINMLFLRARKNGDADKILDT